MTLETFVGEGDERWETLSGEIREMISDKIGIGQEKITYDAHFVKDLNADSLDLVEVVMGVEEIYDLQIPEPEAETLTTLRKATDYVFKRKYSSPQ